MFRVIIGRFWSSVVWIVLATFDWVTSIIGASPVTVRVSCRPASASLKSADIVALMVSCTLLRTDDAKPASSVSILYTPGSSPGIEYTPSAFVTVARATPVATLVAVTVTPGKTASP